MHRLFRLESILINVIYASRHVKDFARAVLKFITPLLRQPDAPL
ncbi:MAG: hypothetical protein ACR2MG_00655 [Pyrinomonadaceae bacterium]